MVSKIPMPHGLREVQYCLKLIKNRLIWVHDGVRDVKDVVIYIYI